MLLIDSSVIIAAFRENEEYHNDALQILENNKNFLVLDYVLSEVLTVLKMREGYETAMRCLDFLQNNEEIIIKRIDDELFNLSLVFFQENKNNLSFVDTLLVVESKLNSFKLATFDRDIIKLLK